MKNKLIAQDFWLKPTLRHSPVWSYDKGLNGGYVADYKNIGEDLRVVGTKEQIHQWVSDNKIEIKDIWNVDLTDKHKELYKRNCDKIVIIGLI
tara:strand:- start:262 stop:540 length:279 start_codon:yes stop_codon:yes gene_type:complete